MARAQVLSMVLAGGEGKRLQPLTTHRAKPAVPFGGNYRLIDFVLSNLVNASFRRIVVLTQYKSHSLDRHLAQTWRMSPLLGNYVTPVGPQMRRGPHWFTGSADAIYQNLELIGDEQPEYLLVFGADHVYRMDPRHMLEAHIESGAGVTVAGIRVPRDQAGQFGVIQTTSSGPLITGFEEKPARATGLHDAPDQVLASMGNYIFTTKALTEAVLTDAEDRTSAHDIGGNIIPMLVRSREAAFYDFGRNEILGATARDSGYWRDIGTLDAYYDAHMDLVSVHPVFNLYNKDWPILTWHEPLPPAKFVFEWPGRVGHALDSMVCAGVVVSGGVVRRSILSPDVVVHSNAEVEGSVLLHGVDVGRHAIVRNAIVDKGVRIPEGARIGLDPDRDRARFTVSPGGIVVIGKGSKVEPE